MTWWMWLILPGFLTFYGVSHYRYPTDTDFNDRVGTFFLSLAAGIVWPLTLLWVLAIAPTERRNRIRDKRQAAARALAEFERQEHQREADEARHRREMEREEKVHRQEMLQLEAGEQEEDKEDMEVRRVRWYDE